MVGPFVSLLVIGTLIGGIAVWVRRSGPEAERGLDEQATAERPGDEPATGPSRPPLLTEAVGYIGTILVLAGASAGIGQRWKDIPNGGRLAIMVAATVLFHVSGVIVRSSKRAALRRLTGVTWAVSVAGFAGSAAVLNAIADTSARTAFLTVAAPSAAYAALLWSAHRHPIQHAVMYAAALLATASLIAYLVHPVEPWMIAVPLWAIGLGWAAAGWWRRIDPWYVAVPLGLLTSLVAPTAIEVSGARFGLGLTTAAAVMGFAVAQDFVPGLAMGAVALLGYLIGTVAYYFGDTLGVPITLTIAGLVVLLFAVAGTRWHRPWRDQPRPPRPRPPRRWFNTPVPH